MNYATFTDAAARWYFCRLAAVPSYAATTVLWLSQPGTVSNLHYDRSHNFYIQLGGRKRFTLVPPSEWPYTYLYPWLHPCYHQSQVVEPAAAWATGGTGAAGVDDVGLISYQAARNVSVILEPGDALYVPPFWLHRVETLDSSPPSAAGVRNEDSTTDTPRRGVAGVSVSVVSPSRDEMYYSDAYWKLRPFSQDWDLKIRVIAVGCLLDSSSIHDS